MRLPAAVAQSLYDVTNQYVNAEPSSSAEMASLTADVMYSRLLAW